MKKAIKVLDRVRWILGQVCLIGENYRIRYDRDGLVVLVRYIQSFGQAQAL
jgi:hypothetical protein